MRNIKTICANTLISVAVLFMATVLLGLESPVSASQNVAGTSIDSTQQFYSYTTTSENLDLLFTKITNNPVGSPANDVTITVRGPGIGPLTCTITDVSAVSTNCGWTNLIGTSSGIWRVDFTVANPINTQGQLQGADSFSWQITPQSGVTDLPGRTWTNEYVLEQGINTNDLEFFYKDQRGYLYDVGFNQYAGINSLFRADSTGVRYNNSCISAYKSILTADTSRSFSNPNECGQAYKIFFEEPDSALLPAQAELWGSGVNEWLDSSVLPATIDSFTFTAANSSTQNGTFDYSVSNFTGQALIEIDTNNNGSFADAVDTSRPTFIAQNNTSLTYDGLDGQANPIPAYRVIRARLNINSVGEVHFINQDVERRNGGIQVELLNGPTAGDDTIYWDDTELANTQCTTTPQLDGTAGVSSATGVHSWDWCFVDGWGNNRIIDDWAFVDYNESEQITIAGRTVIELANDNFQNNTVSSIDGGVAGYAFTNDTLNGSPFTPNQVSVTLLNDGGFTGVTIRANGEVDVPANSPVGNYTLTYQVCSAAEPTVCDTATILVRVVVTSSGQLANTGLNRPLLVIIAVAITVSGVFVLYLTMHHVATGSRRRA